MGLLISESSSQKRETKETCYLSDYWSEWLTKQLQLQRQLKRQERKKRQLKTRQEKTGIYHNSASAAKNGRRRRGGCFLIIFIFVTMKVIFSAEEFNHKQSDRDLTINSKGNRNFCDVCTGGQHFTAWV